MVTFMICSLSVKVSIRNYDFVDNQLNTNSVIVMLSILYSSFIYIIYIYIIYMLMIATAPSKLLIDSAAAAARAATAVVVVLVLVVVFVARTVERRSNRRRHCFAPESNKRNGVFIVVVLFGRCGTRVVDDGVRIH